MNKYILMAILTVVSNNVIAEWEPAMYNKGNTQLIYVDASTIQKSTNGMTMWSMVDLKTPDYYERKSYMSMKNHREYDCRGRRLRVLFTSAHSKNLGNGDLIASDNNLYNWIAVPVGSTGEALWKIACGILKPH
jgi:hypothetical protein